MFGGEEHRKKHGGFGGDMMSGVAGAAAGAFFMDKWDDHKEKKRAEEGWDEMAEGDRNRREQEVRSEWESEMARRQPGGGGYQQGYAAEGYSGQEVGSGERYEGRAEGYGGGMRQGAEGGYGGRGDYGGGGYGGNQGDF